MDDYHQDNKRNYLRCHCCNLVFVPEEYHLSAEDEKAQYDYHQNDPEDSGYRHFLSRTFEPLLARLKKDAIGLDFGCGSGQPMSKMGAERGIKIYNYDLYYYNDRQLLNKRYDFITMTEVMEHIAEPGTLLALLDSLMKPKAVLAIMTKLVIDQQRFNNWHYKNDPTHICFYSIETFRWIAKKQNWHIEVIDKDVVFFYKRPL